VPARLRSCADIGVGGSGTLCELQRRRARGLRGGCFMVHIVWGSWKEWCESAYFKTIVSFRHNPLSSESQLTSTTIITSALEMR